MAPTMATYILCFRLLANVLQGQSLCILYRVGRWRFAGRLRQPCSSLVVSLDQTRLELAQ